jgi:hypothetical protein
MFLLLRCLTDSLRSAAKRTKASKPPVGLVRGWDTPTTGQRFNSISTAPTSESDFEQSFGEINLTLDLPGGISDQDESTMGVVTPTPIVKTEGNLKYAVSVLH